MDAVNSSEKSYMVTFLKVRSEAKMDFAHWEEKMHHLASTFPGFVSHEIRSIKKLLFSEWTSVHRFKTAKELADWKYSDERRELLREVRPLLYGGEDSEIKEWEENQLVESVSEVFVTRVSSENYEAYRKWASRIQKIEVHFQGYQGVYIQAPERETVGNWITVLRFDTPGNLDAWLSSPERASLLKESEKFVQDLQSHRIVSPFEGWFGHFTQKEGEAPSVWKQTMLVLLVLYPIVMLEIKFLNPRIDTLNRSLAIFIGNAISVTLVSWPMMPLVIWMLSWWLAPGNQKRAFKTTFGIFIIVCLYLAEIFLFWS